MHLSAGIHGGQKKALDILEPELQSDVSSSAWYWEPNSGPRQKQRILLCVSTGGGPFAEASYLLPPPGVQESNSGHKA